MSRPPVPAGYDLERERGAIVVALPSVMQAVCAAIRDAGTLYAAAAGQPDAQAFAGRGNAYHMQSNEDEWVVRHYSRGGAAARVLTDQYVRTGVPRPLKELHASVAARARGVATPEVVASVIYPAGPVYRGDIATRYVPRSAPLADVAISSERREAAVRIGAWRAAGRLMRAVFDAGVEHADLNLRNILIQMRDGAEPEALLLDLDRAVVHSGPLSPDSRQAALERLHRSRRKLEALSSYETPAAELEAFQRALRGAA